MSSPYLSKVRIKNFRNFKDVTVSLEKQQIVIGENNVGKTNFIRAIQLILDPSLSEEERHLSETDFFDGLESPMENNEIIEVEIELKNYEKNVKLLAVLADATVRDTPKVIRLTYRFFPEIDLSGKATYKYKIFQGENESLNFGYNERRYLNIKVIPPIRDVERDIRNNKKSPIKSLLKNYEIDINELELISEELDSATNSLLNTDELIFLTDLINSKFSAVVNSQIDLPVSFNTIDIAPSKLLNTLKIVLGNNARGLGDTSLGINNLLYISLLMLSIEDNTVPNIIYGEQYDHIDEDGIKEVIQKNYKLNSNGKYIIKPEISEEEYMKLYRVMDENFENKNFQGFSILVVEEPEAHLHPALQRTIYKDIFSRDISLLMTTHSPYITSVAPLNSIVYLRKSLDGTLIHSTASLTLESGETKDLERYIDVKRGELYFGKGVILVEGIAEEYLIPEFSKVLEKDLDRYGIVCCNINSTNFKPYYKFLRELKIPTAIITDGDYYYMDENTKGKVVPVYNRMEYNAPDDPDEYFDGNNRMEKLGKDLKLLNSTFSSDDSNAEEIFNDLGFFIGYYTLEIDIFESLDEDSIETVVSVFNELTVGKNLHKENFKKRITAGRFDECLKMIEGKTSKIGKGRFAQRLSLEVTKDMVPEYIENAIDFIVEKVKE